ncbi:MAG: hypothetical protein ACOCSP_01345 [archaeon]
MSSDDGPTDAGPPPTDGNDDTTAASFLSRRLFLAGLGGIGVGTAIGVSYGFLGTDEEDGRAIEPEEPNEDGEATLAEFHYILENSGEENARLDVTEFRYFPDDDVIYVTYRTRASDDGDDPPQRQHVREVGQMVRMFTEYVTQNGKEGSVVHAHIENPHGPSEQPDGYLVRREWVRQFADGELSGSDIVNQVLASAYTDEAIENASENETSPPGDSTAN